MFICRFIFFLTGQWPQPRSSTANQQVYESKIHKSRDRINEEYYNWNSFDADEEEMEKTFA